MQLFWGEILIPSSPASPNYIVRVPLDFLVDVRSVQVPYLCTRAIQGKPLSVWRERLLWSGNFFENWSSYQRIFLHKRDPLLNQQIWRLNFGQIFLHSSCRLWLCCRHLRLMAPSNEYSVGQNLAYSQTSGGKGALESQAAKNSLGCVNAFS